MTNAFQRVIHLVLARESDAYALALIRGMILQTHLRYPHLPGHDALVSAAEEPILDPARFGAREYSEGKSRAVLFEIGGTWCLYSRGSAAKSDADGDNGFAKIVSQVISDLRPENIYLATFGRLVRSPEFSSKVYAAITALPGCTLHCGDFALDMSMGFGRQMFQMLVMFASMERDQQVLRTTLGRLARFRDGAWTLGAKGIPLGYVLDRKSGRVTIDEDARPIVTKMLELLADPTKSATDIAMMLGAKGLRTPLQTGEGWAYDRTGVPEVGVLDGGECDFYEGQERETSASGFGSSTDEVDDADVSHIVSPAALVARWVDLLALYETGMYNFFWRSPIKGVRQYGEYKVEIGDEHTPDRLRLNYELGLPSGGWASPETFAQIRAVRREVAASHHTASQARDTQLPFLGNLGRWAEDGKEYALLSQGNPSSYQLRTRTQRPFRKDRFGRDVAVGWIRRSKRDGQQVAMMYAAELHQSIFTTVPRAIKEGVPAERIAGAQEFRALLATDADRPFTRAEEEVRLRRHLADAQRQAEAARREMYDLQDDHPLRQAVRNDAERLQRAVELAERSLNRFFERPETISTPQLFDAEIDLLVGILAVLGNAQGPTPRAFTKMVGIVFSDLRFKPTPLSVEWSIKVRIPVDGDVLVLGPITGQVPQRLAISAGPSAIAGSPSNLDARTRVVAERLMTSDDPVALFRTQKSRDGQAERSRAVGLLKSMGLPDGAGGLALNCPIRDTRVALWARLTNGPLPAHIDPEFADHVVNIYRNGKQIPRWYANPGFRSNIIEFLVASGGQAQESAVREMIVNAGGLPGTLQAILNSPRPTVARSDQPCPPGCTDGRRAHAVLSLIECPHCGPGHYASVIATTVECPVGVLCPKCRRMPVTKSPEFPSEYLSVTADDAQRRLDDVSPRTRSGMLELTRRVAKPGSQAAVRAWANSRGLLVSDRGRLSAELVREYEAAHAGVDLELAPPLRPKHPGAKPDNSKVRVWARSQGLEVGSRGQVPDDVLQEYRRTHFRDLVVPHDVREWAHSQGIHVAASGPLPKAIIDTYLLRGASTPDARSLETSRPSSAVVRAWAKQQGHPVPPRGSVPAYLIDAFLSTAKMTGDAHEGVA